jgi:hypothetical protein
MTSDERSARLLELHFEGFFMCRVMTNPGPAQERRSGYTMALVHEDPLDQVIRLQADEKFARKNLRAPAREMGIRIGVGVNNVTYDGKPYEPGIKVLRGASVSLEGSNPPFDGPIFDSRSNIAGSDDNMMFVVNPLDLVIRGKGVKIRAVDHLNPADPDQKIWQIEDPSIYDRRLPTVFSSSSPEVKSVLGVFDQRTYYNDRLLYLRQRKAELEARRTSGQDVQTLDTQIQELDSRIDQIEFWGDRFFSKMAFQLIYELRTNGRQTVDDKKNALRGTADTSQPWPITFWFGGWDGDLLVGYMQGTLGIPFVAEQAPGG